LTAAEASAQLADVRRYITQLEDALALAADEIEQPRGHVGLKPTARLDASQVEDHRGRKVPRTGSAEALVGLGGLLVGRFTPHRPAGSILPGFKSPAGSRKARRGPTARTARKATNGAVRASSPRKA
jgi:hypothetical protein